MFLISLLILWTFIDFKVPIHPKTLCDDRYRNIPRSSDDRPKIKAALPTYFDDKDSSILCAGDLLQKIGTCPGDSGMYIHNCLDKSLNFIKLLKHFCQTVQLWKTRHEKQPRIKKQFVYSYLSNKRACSFTNFLDFFHLISFIRYYIIVNRATLLVFLLFSACSFIISCSFIR